ncbi:MAG: SDR family NAD(P)-dependent oxidoreductase [Cyclobacteriaceae bacterium]
MDKVLVTGGARGIGEHIVRQMCKLGYHVIIAARDEERAQRIIDEIYAGKGGALVEFSRCDLSSIQSTFEFIEKVKVENPDLKVLINNAGIWPNKLELNTEGIEMAFMVNHIAPMMLSLGLKNLLISNGPSRIVNVNAGLYLKGNFHPEKTPTGVDFHKIKTYANTKLCSVMFGLEFQQLIKDQRLTLNMIHPGVIKTDLGDFGGVLGFLLRQVKKLWKPVDKGAEIPVWLAIDPALEGVTGQYYNERKPLPYSDKALDVEARKKLWQISMAMIQSTVSLKY